MTDAQRRASIERHAPYLTPAQAEALMPSEAELIAIDRSLNIAKQSGAYDRLRERFAMRAELYMEGR